MGKILSKVGGFFAAVPNAVAGVINGEELFKALATASGAGTLAGISAGNVTDFISAILPAIPAIVTSGPVAGLAVAVGTLVVDLYRRKAHGDAQTSVS